MQLRKLNNFYLMVKDYSKSIKVISKQSAQLNGILKLLGKPPIEYLQRIRILRYHIQEKLLASEIALYMDMM